MNYISYTSGYQSSKSSVYYWRMQLLKAKTEKRKDICNKKIEEWGGLLAEYRKRSYYKHGRPPGSLNKKNPRYVPPAMRETKKRTEAVKKAVEEWKPVPLSWD